MEICQKGNLLHYCHWCLQSLLSTQCMH